MRLAVAIDNRFVSHRGAVYDVQGLDHSFWDDYLCVFDELLIVGRVRPVDVLPDEARPITGARVTFVPMPWWDDARSYFTSLPRLTRALMEVAGRVDAAILRVPGLLGPPAALAFRRARRPYAVEVVGSAIGMSSSGDFEARAIELAYHAATRQVCRGAAAASYVTRGALQSRYPSPRARAAGCYSSLRLEAQELAAPRIWDVPPRPFRIAHVGGMAQERKGQAVLLQAIARCVSAGLDVHVTFAGDGRLRSSLEALVATLGLTGRSRFVGFVPRERLFAEVLDRHDLFALPSTAEGLPRVLIEAMARGLPVLASRDEGVAEILSTDCLVAREPAAWAARIDEAARDPAWLTRRSSEGLTTARQFTSDVLSARRRAFYAAYAELVRDARRA